LKAVHALGLRPFNRLWPVLQNEEPEMTEAFAQPRRLRRLFLSRPMNDLSTMIDDESPMPIELATDLTQTLHSLLDVDQPSFAPQPDARIGNFLGYWAALAAAKGCYPARTDLDPICMDAGMLPYLFLVDVLNTENGQFRFRYRLLGSAIVDLELARNGNYLDEIASRDVSDIQRHYEAAIMGSISLRRSNLGWQRKPLAFQRYSVVVLPLSDDGRVPTHLFGLCLYDD
jgi:hypothetical protein